MEGKKINIKKEMGTMRIRSNGKKKTSKNREGEVKG